MAARQAETAARREEARGELAAAVEDAVRRWQREHPRASLDEIVAAVDAALAPLRARYVADLAAAEEEALAAEAPVCPGCGGRLERRGRRAREVLAPGSDRPLRLERAYLVCSSCGTSLSPPR